MLSIGTIVLLISGATVAGFVDSICGGGGLLSIPILLSTGLSPIQSLASNKLQGFFGALSSGMVFAKAGYFEWKKIMPILIVSAIFSALGTYFLRKVSPEYLLIFIPIILVIVSVYFLVSKRVCDKESAPQVTELTFALLVASAIGFYDGFLGAGTGSFFMVTLISLLGYSTTKALAHSKVLNLATNVSSLLIFIIMGQVVWVAGLAMSLGEIIGAFLGSKLAIKKGTIIIKPLIVIASMLMLIKIILNGV